MLTELTTRDPEIPDALGWLPNGWSIMVECKTSRSDFLADKKKGDRRLGQERYYLTPKGLLDPTQVPEPWGLLEVWGTTVRVIRKASTSLNYDLKMMRREHTLLLAAIKRIQWFEEHSGLAWSVVNAHMVAAYRMTKGRLGR